MAKRKQLMFDLDTKALKKYDPTRNWRNASEEMDSTAKLMVLFFVSKMKISTIGENRVEGNNQS